MLLYLAIDERVLIIRTYIFKNLIRQLSTRDIRLSLLNSMRHYCVIVTATANMIVVGLRIIIAIIYTC